MEILNVVLRNYKRFKLGNIQHLQAQFPNPTNVIIGTNGSGKSCLLRELSPLPTPRTEFHKNGYKQLQLLHQGKLYVLTSDYSNKNAPHSFVCDGEELNPGGTTPVQTELASVHLGYDSNLESLLYLTTKLTRMSRSERKNYLLQLHPVDLSLAMDIHKRSLSKVRECKNNLTHLRKRKADIQAQMMSAEMLAEIKQHRQELEQSAIGLDRVRFGIEQYIQQLKQKLKHADVPTVETLTSRYGNWIKHIRGQLIYYSDVNRDMPTVTLEQLTVQEAMLKQKWETAKESADSLLVQLQEYRTQISHHQGKPISEVETEIQHLDSLLAELIVDDQLPLLSDQDELDHQRLITDIRPLVTHFVERNRRHRLWTPRTLNRVQQAISGKIQDLQYINRQLQDLETEHAELETQCDKLQELVPADCSLSHCNLRVRYNSRQQELDQKSLRNRKQHADLSNTKQRADRIYCTLTKLIDRQRGYVDLYQQISDIWRANPVTRLITLTSTLHAILDRSPEWIPHYLETIWLNSQLLKKKADHHKHRTALQQELDTLIKARATSEEFMQGVIQDSETKMQDLTQLLINTETQLQLCSNQKQLHQSFVQIKAELVTNYTQFKAEVELFVTAKTVEYYQRLLECILQVFTNIQRELRGLDATIKEQDALKARYDSEVIQQITEIDTKLKLFAGIESVLSPHTGIPHQYMVDFINTLIHNVNCFIGPIFSYPLKLQALSSDAPLDFVFPFVVNGEVTADISLGSNGQQEVIDLAWVLAILKQKKAMAQYPMFLDEFGWSFSPNHQVALLEFLKQLQVRQMIHQLFIINHQTIYAEGFNNSDVICLYPEDTILAENVNTHVKLL